MKSTAIARRYETFQTVFEKQVGLVQVQVRELEKLRPIHNVVCEVLELANLPNDTQVKLSMFGVTVQVVAVHADTFYKFNELAGEIGTRLKTAKLHATGLPALKLGGWHHCFDYTWRCRLPGDRLGLARSLVVEVMTPRRLARSGLEAREPRHAPLRVGR